jgi:hypothetical protein
MSTPSSTPIDAPAGAAADRAAPRRRWLRRGPWENASAIVTGLGIFMQMQPFAVELYSWSFAVILLGTVGFIVTSHFPD